MALLALTLAALVIFGLIGAALSSRSRSEKRSVASFHQHMGQLSGVVKAEVRGNEVSQEEGDELFSSVPSHVRVIGKTGRQGTGSAARRRPHRAGSSSSLGSRRGRTASQSAASQAEHKDALHSGTESARGLSNLESEGSNAGRKMGSSGRRSRVSSSARLDNHHVRRAVLRFDDSPVEPNEVDDGPGLASGERRVNAKVLAAASVAALAGLGAIVYTLSSTHGTVAQSKASVSSSRKTTTSVQPPPNTTLVPKSPAGPLTPTSTSSSGAIYFVNSSSLTVDISASAPSWVEECITPNSKVLWQGIIPSGGSKSFTLDSSMWIRTGNVGVLTITANGQPVTFNANPGVYDFTFRQGVKA